MASGDSFVLDITVPSNGTSLLSLFERPASYPLNKSGIRSRIVFSGKIQKLRNMSPQIKELYEAVEKSCKEWLRLRRGKKDKKTKERSISGPNRQTRCFGKLQDSCRKNGQLAVGYLSKSTCEERQGTYDSKSCAGVLLLPFGRGTEDFQARRNGQDRIGEKLWDDNYGPEGLTQVLHDNVNPMRELRMITEYGDYLTLGLESLCQHNMDDLVRRTLTVNWKELWQSIRLEQQSLEKYNSAFQSTESRPPATPFLDDILKTSIRTGINRDLRLFEIETYATRNEIYHSDTKGLINRCSWDALAKRILTDLENVKEVFKLYPDKGQRMEEAIKTQKDKWFVYVNRVGRGHGSVIYEITHDAKKKQEALLQRILSDTP